MTIEITGSMAGYADRHTESSLAESFENAYFTAPWDIYEGPLKDFPKEKIRLEAEPLVLFAHGSSGIGEPLKAFGRWLASFGIGFLCPNSFVLKDRITYTSPVSREDYERIHAMRSAELAHAAQGRTAQVLLETPLSSTLFTGYTKQYLPVVVNAPGHKSGEIVTVTLGEWDGKRCRAQAQ